MIVRMVVAFVIAFAMQVLSLLLAVMTMWFGFGPRFAFSGDGPLASTFWVLGMLMGCFVGSCCGAAICSWIFRRSSHRGRWISTAAAACFLCLVISGRVTHVPTALPEGKGIDDLSFAEAGDYAVTPDWYFPTAGLMCIVGLRAGRGYFYLSGI